MIFVTVGTHDKNFNRLVCAADNLAALVDEDVVIQRGSSDYLPKHAKYFDWTTMREMEMWISRSRLVIAHAGAGIIITVLKRQKPLVVTPRLKVYKEHHDNHQLELATALSEEGRAILVLDLSGESLLNVIGNITTLKQALNQPAQLEEAIHNMLSTWQSSFQQHSGRI